ncbi:BamA/TamA family outer membrane protein [Mesonia sp. MT50]|uniref:BamA/TamA family outer membrane protein n=1 Tax=Mesonia profundi TaxID=3070998 RepID=A0ABU1A2Y7_9FLAO|nr:BamA/TamA family outer membrane protein [Mesonia profundi]MDQ7918075.1 BamA/TamA family outer membrane protein [Mesonia profundi]
MRKHIKINYSFVFIAVILLMVLNACAVKKYVPEGEFLYRGAKINIEDTLEVKNKPELQAELDNLLYPQPNAKFLGLYPGLHYYYIGQKEKPGFINRFLSKKLGEEPVYMSDVDVNGTEDIIENRLENNGFFSSRITSAVERDSSAITAKAEYDVKLTAPYQMETFTVEKDSLDSLSLRLVKDIELSMEETLIEKDMRFDLTSFKKERERIDNFLKQKGYYNFNPNFIIFEADTNQYDKRKFDLFLRLKEGVPERSKVTYILDKVNIYPNEALDSDEGVEDTTVYDRLHYIQKDNFFKPRRMDPYILLRPAQKYNPLFSKYTSRRLSSIGIYKYVNIRYNETDTITDEDGYRHLEADIRLSPFNKRTLRAELQAVTKSNNFAGPGLGLTYLDRNLFRGGEILRITGIFAYEQQFSGQGSQSGLRSIQFGLNSSLTFPRLMFPIDFNKRFKYSIPQTQIKLGVDYLDRSQLYSLTSFSTSFGYIWKANKFVTHEINPININYVKLGNTSDEFNQILEDNPFLKRSFEQQFIAGLTYSFTYNELSDASKRGAFYLKFNFDVAGNTIDLLAKENSEGDRTFLGLKYAQYAKADVDLRYHYKIGTKGDVLIGRVFGGVGLPYGNSKSLPFVKQYFSGGPYSVRAFHIRSLGPGTYNPDEQGISSYYDQAGDIRLEANIEYRFPLFSFLKGAVFADAGNVWLTKENEALPGGKFSGSFADELGIGAGVGLRVDVQGFVIRFDLASPLKRPAKKFDFEYDKPVFNFAIGYPF